MLVGETKPEQWIDGGVINQVALEDIKALVELFSGYQVFSLRSLQQIVCEPFQYLFFHEVFIHHHMLSIIELYEARSLDWFYREMAVLLQLHWFLHFIQLFNSWGQYFSRSLQHESQKVSKATENVFELQSVQSRSTRLNEVGNSHQKSFFQCDSMGLTEEIKFEHQLEGEDKGDVGSVASHEGNELIFVPVGEVDSHCQQVCS